MWLATAGLAGAVALCGATVAMAPPATGAPATSNGPPSVPIAKGATYVDGHGAPTPLVPDQVGFMRGLSCPTSTLCYAVGATPPNTITTGTAGMVLTLQRGAAGRWSITKATSDWTNLEYLTAISCSDPTHCAAVGEGDGNVPVVESTADGNSANWDEPPVPTDSPRLNLEGVSCADRSCMAAGGYQVGTDRSISYVSRVWVTSGTAPTTVKGDLAWVAATAPRGALGLWGLSCTSPGHCWVVSGGAWYTSDNGRRWVKLSPPELAGPCATRLCQPIYSLLDTVQFSGPRDGVVAGGSQCGAAVTFSCPGAVARAHTSSTLMSAANTCVVNISATTPNHFFLLITFMLRKLIDAC